VSQREGSSAYTDGECLYLPPDAEADTVVVQAALVAAGSLDRSVMLRVVGKPRSRSRYLTLEAARAVYRLRRIIPASTAAAVAALLPGAPTTSAEESLSRAGSSRIPVAPRWLGEIRPSKLLVTGHALADVTDEMCQRAEQQHDMLEDLDDESSDDSERSAILGLLSAPISNPLAKKLASILGMGSSPSSEDSETGDDVSLTGNKSGRQRTAGKQAGVLRRLQLTMGTDVPDGQRYPEWSSGLGKYLSDWCTVTERVPPMNAAAPPPAARADKALERNLARFALRPETHGRQPDGDSLDLSALVDFVADRAAGQVADPRVYTARRPTARDLGVLILLDTSGSTGESTSGKQVFEGQRQLAAQLTSALEAVGDRVATYGFYSRGRNDVRFLYVKSFADRYGGEPKARLAALEPSGFTRLGAAVRHATHLLSTQAGTTNRLLLLIGDGLPYDNDYEGGHANEDARRALSEAVAKGIGCACIAIRSTTKPDVIEHVWGHVAHRELDGPEEMPQHVQRVFRQALRDAGASRKQQARTPRPAHALALAEG
jgi:nitric oxide reductase activation protein